MASQRRPEYLRLTRFFGTLLVINVAVGVVTGLVQEFQFGMNWSGYSRFVGDVFGAPLAMEGLAAFFLESTFLGLWLFGWGRLSPRVHLATIWVVALGGVLSAAFIMAANSWMQHPVGYAINPATGRAAAHRHLGGADQPGVPAGATCTCCSRRWSPRAVVMLAVSAWHLRRGLRRRGVRPARRGWPSRCWPRPSLLNLLVGSELGVIEGRYQPMKIAAAEAQWETCQPCSFSLFQIGGGNNDQTPTQIIEIPHLLSMLATNSWNGQVVGLNELQAQYTAAVRAGRLRAQRVHPVLVDAGDGLPRRPDPAVGAVGVVAAQAAGDLAVVPAGRHLGRSRCRS